MIYVVTFGQDQNPQGPSDNPDHGTLFSSPRFAGLFLVGGALVWLSANVLGWSATKPDDHVSPVAPIFIIVAFVGAVLAMIGERDARRLSRQRGIPAAPPFFRIKLLSPRSLMSASRQVGLPPQLGPIVMYGLAVIAVGSLIHLQAVNSSSVPITPKAQRTHLIHRAPAAVVFAVALLIAVFAVVLALMSHIRVHSLPRFLRRADRELRLEPRNRTPWELMRARRDNRAAMLRRFAQWDVRTHFSQKVRLVSLWIAALAGSVAAIDLIIHLVAK
jgi:hypothetical protein